VRKGEGEGGGIGGNKGGGVGGYLNRKGDLGRCKGVGKILKQGEKEPDQRGWDGCGVEEGTAADLRSR